MHFTIEKVLYLLKGIYLTGKKQIVYKDLWSDLHPSVIKEKKNKPKSLISWKAGHLGTGSEGYRAIPTCTQGLHLGNGDDVSFFF